MTKELITDLRAEADGCRDQDGIDSGTAVLLDRAADVLEARQPTEDDREALARVMDELAYYHCRSVNPKADHPRMGYHAFSEDQREHLREAQREAAEEIMRMVPALSRAAVPDAATERVTENSVRHVKRLTAELQNKRESLNDQRREFRKLLANARAERDAALAAIERVAALASRAQTFGADEFGAFKRELLAALDGAPEPEGRWEYRGRLQSCGYVAEGYISAEHAMNGLKVELEDHPYLQMDDTAIVERARVREWLPVEGESKP